MNRTFLSIKLFIQFAFAQIIFLWANAIKDVILSLENWAIAKGNQIQETAAKLLLEDEQKREVDSFVKNMQRQAKINGARLKKDI